MGRHEGGKRETVAFSITLPAGVYESLRSQASEKGVNVRDHIRDICARVVSQDVSVEVEKERQRVRLAQIEAERQAVLESLK